MRTPSGAVDTESEDAGTVGVSVGSCIVAVGMGGVKVGVIPAVAIGAGETAPQAAS